MNKSKYNIHIQLKSMTGSKSGIILITFIAMIFTIIINNSCKKNKNIPDLTTYTITNVTETNAISGGYISSDGGTKITERGVCWSTNEHPTISDSKTSDGKGTGPYSSTITGFTSNTRYYVRAYATNKIGTAYGSEVTFLKKTAFELPVITTYAAVTVTQVSATSGGNITSDGGSEITERGVCWNVIQNPVITDSHTSNGKGKGIFISNITGLTSGSTYYARAYATNSTGTVYGNQISFTAFNLAVSTGTVSNITQSSAICGGTVLSDGGSAITARGVCWSTSQNPVSTGSHTNDSTGIGSFTSNITGLSANTTYYVRAYVSNSYGTAYGNEINFTTSTVNLTTTPASNISNISAISGGDITSDGGSAITERGVCWKTTQNPTTSNNHTSDGTGTGNFISNITGLNDGVTYYVRAYAKNSGGTTYGNQISFTTLPDPTMPLLTTTAISSITQYTSISGGNITSDGGAAVTARGVCWSTSSYPEITDNFTTDGSGTGSFTSNISGLTGSTTYFVRAYATNSVGTSYGNQVSFTTTIYCPTTVNDIDGNTYNAVGIGSQCWMAENLKTTKYTDGAIIPNVSDNAEWSNLNTGAYCEYNNLTANSDVYGKLYNWFAATSANNICPNGWHLPTDADWTQLIDYLGSETIAGGKMKETGTIHWTSPNTGADNSSGFTGLPGGNRNYTNGTFSNLTMHGFWWSSVQYDSGNANHSQLSYNYTYIFFQSLNKKIGLSVRCIKN